MAFKTIAVLGGTGGLGAHIVSGLVSRKTFNVIVYSRPSSVTDASNADKIKNLESQGVRVVGVDSSDVDAFSAQLKADGVQVLVSAVGAGALSEQIKYIDAAKAAGVQRFIPSEFGVDSDHHSASVSVLALKAPVREHLRKSGLEYTLVFNGFFTEYAFSPFLGFDFAAKTVTTVGDGDVPFSFTGESEVGKFVAALLADEDTERTKNKSVFIESGKLTWNQAIALVEEVSNSKFQVTRVPVEEAEASIATAEFLPGLLTQFRLAVARGQGILSHNHNAQWPEVTVQPTKDFVQTLLLKSSEQ